MAEAGEIIVRVLMVPLPSHSGAKEQTVSVICDGRSFEDLDQGYRSENQCEEGRKLVEETVAFLQSKGIGSTPTYIFPDGLYQPGLLEADALRERLGLAAAPER